MTAPAITQYEHLWTDTLYLKSLHRDWSEGYPDKWDFYEGTECPECNEYGVGHAGQVLCVNEECPRFDEWVETEGVEGPMMMYTYPLPELRQDSAIEATKLILDLPLCIVEENDPDGYVDSYSLALTGGGMDLSWEICEAFARLGWLPPLSFIRLPAMSGRGKSDHDRTIITACRRSIEVGRAWLDNDETHLNSVMEGT